MGELQELHSKIDVEIVSILLSVIPEGWYSIRLDVEHIQVSDAEDEFPMSISNNEGLNEIVIPPDGLYEQVLAHSRVFKNHGKQWKKLIYNVTFDEETENWKYGIDFKY